MLIEEEAKPATEINPDALEAVFEVDSIVEEEEVLLFGGDDEQSDDLDIPFTDDEGHW